jgi:outer membrane immunogenic protein
MLRYACAAFVAAGLALSGTARATDLYVPETPEYAPLALWTGFYVGGHIGGAFGDIDVTDTYDYTGDPIKDSNFGASGLLTGVQIGYNIQNGNFVYGIEADLGYMKLSGNKTTDLPGPDDDDSGLGLTGKYSAEGGIYGDLTARLGYATDNVLFYVKGGGAFLNADFTGNYVGDNCTTIGTCGNSNKPSTFDFETGDTLLGWTVGVGVEYALSASWSLKVEYQHFDFSAASLDHNGTFCFKKGKACPENSGYSSTLKGDADFDTTVDAVKVGLNYQIGKEDALK